MDFSALLSKLILLLAIGLIIWQARKLFLARASTNWKQTKGKVLKAYIDESNDDDGGVTHFAKVHYSYKIGTRAFESTCLTYRPTSGLMFSKAIDLLQGITQGREVDVFYDPRRPRAGSIGSRRLLGQHPSSRRVFHFLPCGSMASVDVIAPSIALYLVRGSVQVSSNVDLVLSATRSARKAS